MASLFLSQMDHVRKLLAQKDCVAVSFDIFDTLLIRPGIFPLDVLFFMRPGTREVVPDPDFDFMAARRDAEDIARAKLFQKRPDYGEITLAEIYESLAEDHGLSSAQKEALMAAEIETEIKLLKRNECVAKVFEEALHLGKKVFLISDMYLGRDVLERALQANGLAGFSGLYVSSEIRKRKDSGALFEHVLKNEKLNPGQLLHIGDNPRSDFSVPRDLGIVSCLLPGALDIMRATPGLNARVFQAMAEASVESRLLLGLAVKKLLSDYQIALDGKNLFLENPFVFGYLGAGPFLTGVVHSILGNSDVSSGYKKIHFASRDGFLPLQAYREMKTLWPDSVDADYLYAGRRAYNIYKFNGSCLEYLAGEIQELREDGYSVKNLLDAMVVPGLGTNERDLSWDILSGELSKSEKALKAFLQKNGPKIDALLGVRKEAARAYYAGHLVCNEKGRAIVFDLGYSGSVSSATGQLAGCLVDKIYVWQTEKNIGLDRANGTTTYALVPDPQKLGGGILRGNIIFEELFSSLEASCIGFQRTDDGIVPLFDEHESVPESMRRRLLEIQQAMMAFVRDSIAHFAALLPALAVRDIGDLLIPLRLSINGGDSADKDILAPIVFTDKFFHSADKSLRTKIIEAGGWASVDGKQAIPK